MTSSTGICAMCGRSGRIEAHHVAGRANDPAATVNVCPECHRWCLTVWQNAAGVELRHDGPRSDADRLRALIVGVFGALATHLQRTPGTPEKLDRAVMLALRGWSRLLDLAEPYDRAGRWTPAPDIQLRTAEPVTSGTDFLAALAGMAALAAPLARQVHGEQHPVTRVIEHARRDPAVFLPAVERLLTEPGTADAVRELLTDAMARTLDAARTLLAAPDPATVTDAQAYGPVIDATRALLATHREVAELLAAALTDDTGECAA
jgi:hypothetical protein